MSPNIKNIGSRVYRSRQRLANHRDNAYPGALCFAQNRCGICQNYPKVNLTIKQGSPSAIAQMVSSGEADLAIITERIDDHPELGKLPCYEWNHAVIVPHDHPLLDCRNPLKP